MNISITYCEAVLHAENCRGIGLEKVVLVLESP